MSEEGYLTTTENISAANSVGSLTFLGLGGANYQTSLAHLCHTGAKILDTEQGGSLGFSQGLISST